MAMISYLGILWIVPLLTESKKDPFVKYHIKQGIILTIAGVVVWIIAMLIPYIAFFLAMIIIPLLDLALFVLVVVGIVNAAGGKQVPLPLIGSLASNLKF